MATSNPFVSKEHKGKISCKFGTSPDILVAKGENISANTTLLVTISSPDLYGIYIYIYMILLVGISRINMQPFSSF